MIDQSSLHYNPDRIQHEWLKRQNVRVFLEVLILVFVNLIFIPLTVLTILGYREFLGVHIGEPNIRSSLSIFSWLFVDYLFLSSLLNKTIVEITPRALFIRITPIPWPVRGSIDLSDIKQVKVAGNIQKFGRRILFQEYSVQAQLQDGKHVTIIDNIWSRETADDYLRRIAQAAGHLSK